MKIIEIREKVSIVTLLIAGVFIAIIAYALVSGTAIVPHRYKVWEFINITRAPEDFWFYIKFISWISVLCAALSKIKFSLIEEPISKIRGWYKHQRSIQDPQKLSAKYVLACILPFLATVIVLMAILILLS